MNLAIRYYTRSGNTAKLAKAISERISVPAEMISAPPDEKDLKAAQDFAAKVAGK